VVVVVVVLAVMLYGMPFGQMRSPELAISILHNMAPPLKFYVATDNCLRCCSYLTDRSVSGEKPKNYQC